MLDKHYLFKGRVALYAILRAMMLQEGDEVILPGFTCIVVPNAITYLRGKPVYVDIDPRTYNIDPMKIEKSITKKTKVIIAQHTFGIPSEMDRILEIARKHGLYVIEDSCHALGSLYKGREVGSLGDAAFFSSQWSKPVTSGLGGWAIVNNADLEERMRHVCTSFTGPSCREDIMLRLQYLIFSTFVIPSVFWLAQSSYRTLSRWGITLGSSSKCELESEMPPGYEKVMSSWQRDVLSKKMEKIDIAISHRKSITVLYENLLKSSGFNSCDVAEHCDPVFLRYPLLVPNKAKVLRAARRRRIELGDWFVSPVHPNYEGWEKVGYKKGMCPEAEKLCEQVINLPTHQRIGTAEAKQIVEFVADNA